MPGSSGLVDLEDVGVRLGGIGADGEADGLAHLLLGGAGGPGTCQVALGSVGVARGEIGGEIAEARRLRIESPLLVLPRRDDLFLEHEVSFRGLVQSGHAQREAGVTRRTTATTPVSPK